MDILFLVAFVAFVAAAVALVERNHRRASLVPRAPWGAAEDRDLERVRRDLPDAPATVARRLRLHLPARRRPGPRAAATC